MARRPRDGTRLVRQLPSAFTAADAHARGITAWTLNSLTQQGLIEPLSRGVYLRTDTGSDSDLLAIAARAPRATLCLTSALVRHALVDDIPAAIDVALPRGTRQPALDLPIAWHQFDPATFDIGRDKFTVAPRVSLGLYSPERCIVDAFRLRNTQGQELGNEALRRWLARPGTQPAKLMAMAALFPRASAPLRTALEILL